MVERFTNLVEGAPNCFDFELKLDLEKQDELNEQLMLEVVELELVELEELKEVELEVVELEVEVESVVVYAY